MPYELLYEHNPFRNKGLFDLKGGGGGGVLSELSLRNNF